MRSRGMFGPASAARPHNPHDPHDPRIPEPCRMLRFCGPDNRNFLHGAAQSVVRIAPVARGGVERFGCAGRITGTFYMGVGQILPGIYLTGDRATIRAISARREIGSDLSRFPARENQSQGKSGMIGNSGTPQEPGVPEFGTTLWGPRSEKFAAGRARGSPG